MMNLFKSVFRGEYTIDKTISETKRLSELIDYTPDIIITILNGGKLIGETISSELQKENYEIQVSRNINTKEIYEKFYKYIAKIYQGYLFINAKVSIVGEIDEKKVVGKNILVIDDIYHTGKSYDIIKKELYKKGARNVKIGTLSYINNKNKPDFYLYQGRIRLPWSKNSNYYEDYKNLQKNNIK